MATMTRPPAIVERRRRVRREVVRDVVALLVVAVLLGVAWLLRLTPDEEHPVGVAATAALDATFEAWRDGELELTEEPSDLGDGVSGVLIRRAVGGDRWVVVTEGGTRCYGLWWDEDGVRGGRTLASRHPCEPSGVVLSRLPDDFDRIGRSSANPEEPYDWSPVVPEPERMQYWFLPALIVGLAVALSLLVRLSIVAITHDVPSRVRR
jgi:hypothetical protein